MISELMARILLTIILIFNITGAFCQTLFQGEQTNFLTGYSGKLYFVGSANTYLKASISKCEGPMIIKNKPITGYSFGLGYEVLANSRTKVFLQISTTPEPLYRISFEIPKEEISSTFEKDVVHRSSGYSPMNSFSLSLVLKQHIIEKSNFHFSVIAGGSLKYFPSGSASYSFSVAEERTGINTEYIVLLMRSDENDFHSSFFAGSGFDIPINKIAASIDVFYNHNLYDLISGEYHMGNFRLSEPSNGEISLSGNHFGIAITIRKLYQIKSPE